MIEPPNHTQTPNKLFALIPDMSEAELKVTLIIVRDTFGWQAGGAATERSLRELCLLTGLSKQSVVNGLNAGLQRGTLYKTEGDSNKAAYGLRVQNLDTLDLSKILTGLNSRPESVQNLDTSGLNFRPTLVQNLDHLASAAGAAGRQKADPERKRKEREIKGKKEEEGQTPAAAASEALEGETQIGADRAADPSGSGQEQADSSHGQTQTASDRDGQGHQQEELSGGGRAGEITLRRLMGPKLYEDCVAEDDDRVAWGDLSVSRIADLKIAAKAEAKEKGLPKWRTPFIALLDKEIQPKTAQAPARESVSDQVRARLQGNKS